MPLIVEHAKESDMPRLMEIQFNAFAHEPYHHVLFPGGNKPEARDKAAKRIWKDVQDDPTDNILKCTDTATGEIFTYGKWNVYEKERTKEEYDKHDEVYWCDGVIKEACEEFLHKVHGMRHKAIGGQRHVLLNLLITDPMHQKKGGGRHLVQWGTKKADEMGIPAYLEATAEGQHLYETQGFHVIDDVVIDCDKWEGEIGETGQYRYTMMYRPVGGPKGVVEKPIE